MDKARGQIRAFAQHTETNLGGISGKLAGTLDDVTSSLTAGLGPASASTKAALDRIGQSALTSGNALKLGIAGGAIAGGLALGKFATGGVAKFVDLADEVRNFQRVSGATVADSSRFVAVLDDMGISAETGAKAIFKFGRTIAEGGGELEALGVRMARNADGTTNLTESLLNVADAFAGTPDPAKRAELAAAAFGRAGQDLIPILEQGRKGLEEFFAGAEEHGQILTPEDLRRAREYELALDDLGDAMGGLERQGGRALVPFLTDLAETGTQVLGVAERLSTGFGRMGDGVKRIADRLSFGLIGQSAKEAARAAAEGADDYATSARGVAEAAEAEREALAEDAVALEKINELHRRAAEWADAARRAEDRRAQSRFAILDASIALERSLNSLEDANRDAAEAQVAYNDAVKAHGRNSEEAKAAAERLSRAHLDVKATYLDLAEAAGRRAVQDAEATGKVLDDSEKVRLAYVAQRDELIRLKDSLGPGSALRVALEGLIDSLPPPEVAFNVAADTSKAKPAVAELGSLISGIKADASNIVAHVATGEAERKVVALDSKLRSFSALGAKVTVDADTTAADAAIDRMDARLRTLRILGAGVEPDEEEDEDRPRHRRRFRRFHEGGFATTAEKLRRIDLTARLRADELPAVLQSGEFVMRRQAVDRIGVDLLERLNRWPASFNLPRFHDGGTVGMAVPDVRVPEIRVPELRLSAPRAAAPPPPVPGATHTHNWQVAGADPYAIAHEVRRILDWEDR